MMNESWQEQEPGGAEISCAGPDRLIPDSLRQLRAAKMGCGRYLSNSDRQALTDYHLSPSIPPIKHSTHAQTGLLSAHFVLMMAALERTQFLPFVLPPSRPLSDLNAFCHSNPIYLTRSLNASGSQKIRRPAATFPRVGRQIGADRNAAARAEGTWKSYIESESF